MFTWIYENNYWGNNQNSEYKGSSGVGSFLEHNQNTYIPFLKQFITDNNIRNIVDLGCGDFACGKLIYDDLDILYTGFDAYKKVIDYNSTQFSLPKYSFLHLDFFYKKEDIVNGDLCILKDVLMHWSVEEINIFLDYLVDSKKFKYILICNCCSQKEDNVNITTGDWRELSCDYFPLKKYHPRKLYNFLSNVEKEVSVIEIK